MYIPFDLKAVNYKRPKLCDIPDCCYVCKHESDTDLMQDLEYPLVFCKKIWNESSSNLPSEISPFGKCDNFERSE